MRTGLRRQLQKHLEQGITRHPGDLPSRWDFTPVGIIIGLTFIPNQRDMIGTMVDSYEALLHKAYEEVTEPSEDGERWSYPEPRITIEGKTTILENFTDIVSALRRDPDHLMKFFLGELGTAGKIDGNRVIFNGKFEESMFSPLIKSYVDDYVICSECGKPDTKLFKDDRVLVIKCEACGSHRPVRKRKAKTEAATSSLEAGNIIEVNIESTSRRGDGVAKVGKYIVYVKGGRPGQRLKVRIAKISGSIIFTEQP